MIFKLFQSGCQVFIFLWMAATSALSQVDNDSCQLAFPLPGLETWCSEEGAYRISGATASYVPGNECLDDALPDSWYTIVTQGSEFGLTLNLNKTTPNTVWVSTIYAGICGNLVPIDCRTANADQVIQHFLRELEPDLRLFIQISSADTTSAYQICFVQFPEDPCVDTKLRLPEDTTIIAGNSINISPLSLSHHTGVQTSWYQGNRLLCAGCTEWNLTPDSTRSYRFTATDQRGCTLTDSFTIYVQYETLIPSFYIPNAFSPNGDGVNDEFTIEGPMFPPVRMQMLIYDRWGTTVYNNNTANGHITPWDGQFQGKACSPGIYTYLLIIETADNRKQSTIGHIKLLR